MDYCNRWHRDHDGIFYEVKVANYGSGKQITGQYVQKERREEECLKVCFMRYIS
jgi:hypothetical protein